MMTMTTAEGLNFASISAFGGGIPSGGDIPINRIMVDGNSSAEVLTCGKDDIEISSELALFGGLRYGETPCPTSLDIARLYLCMVFLDAWKH